MGLFLRYFGYFMMFFTLCLMGFGGCATPVEDEPCTGKMSDKKIDTKGKKCQKRCDCNNQKYTGYCLKGVCTSSLRKSCKQKGNIQKCLLPLHLIIKKCNVGSQVCQGTGLTSKVWGDCVLAAPTLNESSSLFCFDGIDNDCDGLIDSKDPDCKTNCQIGSKESCYSGSPKEIGVGICKAGVRSCGKDGIWGKCIGAILPKKEICNNLDDDCDGRLNNGVPNCQKFCKKGESRPCYTGKTGCVLDKKTQKYHCVGACQGGIQQCSSQGFFNTPCVGSIPPKPEICDGLDNDCDGKTDETLTGSLLEQVCYTSTQGCKKLSNGQFSCISPCKVGKQQCSQGQWGECKGLILPTTEMCDGKDNNCNGKVDENIKKRFCYNGPTGTVGLGICKAGYQLCSKGHWGSCIGEVHPQPEICKDGKDNDCDGKIDDGC